MEVSGDGSCDKGVGDAVEAVFAQLVVRGDFLVDGVGPDMRGNSGVEGGVEVGNILCVWKEGRHGTNDG